MKAIIKKLFEVKKRGISLTRDTKAYNYKYATLDQIQEKLNPVLEELKLVVMHGVENNKVVTAIVDVETGEQIDSSIEMFTTKAQERGSEITYYRRYNLVCLFDLEVEDDDGKKAQGSKVTKAKEEPTGDDIFAPLPEMTEANFKDFVKAKDNYMSEVEALKVCESKYTVSKELTKKITALYRE